MEEQFNCNGLEEKLKCSNSWCHRVRRKGKLFCSRCTYKGTEQKLRDVLPGVVDTSALASNGPFGVAFTTVKEPWDVNLPKSDSVAPGELGTVQAVPHHNWKATRNPNSTYIYAGVQ